MKHINQRGAALIVVILIISLIITLTLQLSRSSRSAVYDSVNLSDVIKLDYVAKSGFEIAVAKLLSDKNNYDSLSEDWAQTDKFIAKSKELFEGATCEVSVEDESGKIPLNRLVKGNNFNPEIRNLLVRLLSLPEFSLEPDHVQEIVNSIKDWIDQDGEITENGAETLYYESQINPYKVKNAPLDCIEELLMIKGITKKLLYGTDSTPALIRCITLHGDGKININTAPKLVLRALSSDLTPEMAVEMDEYRRSENNNLSDVNWYKSLKGMANVAIPATLLTIKSDTYRITSSGVLDRMRKSVSGVIKRNQNNQSMSILSWTVK